MGHVCNCTHILNYFCYYYPIDEDNNVKPANTQNKMEKVPPSSICIKRDTTDIFNDQLYYNRENNDDIDNLLRYNTFSNNETKLYSPSSSDSSWENIANDDIPR